MVYGKTKIKSSVYERDNEVYITGSGKCSSDSMYVLREVSSKLTSAVDHANESAYRAHKNR
ncbi:MAG: hypothetical protein J7K26_03105 [Candidatus Aenigmarchaeota archaeon]|nr:hypothetical protein [Candidatus Aenigmarchaeota archaeon]